VTPLEEDLLRQDLKQLAASLRRRTRQQYHQRLAQVLAAQFPEVAETQPELLAYHYTQAGVIAEGIAYWLRAGQHSINRAAFVEASSHVRQGLALLPVAII
jgi:predicted ATPase